MQVEIAAAELADAVALAEVAARSLPRAWSERSFAEALARSACRALVVRGPAGQVIGYVLGGRLGDAVEILSLAVDPPFRRLGLGRRLLGCYLSLLRAEGVRRVELEVRRSNRVAQRLYRELGLVREGERPRYYAGGESALLFGARP
ncbi:MAG: GNAT family N-acetyltransferase [Myxococcota bacterium]